MKKQRYINQSFMSLSTRNLTISYPRLAEPSFRLNPLIPPHASLRPLDADGERGVPEDITTATVDEAEDGASAAASTLTKDDATVAASPSAAVDMSPVSVAAPSDIAAPGSVVADEDEPSVVAEEEEQAPVTAVTDDVPAAANTGDDADADAVAVGDGEAEAPVEIPEEAGDAPASSGK